MNIKIIEDRRTKYPSRTKQDEKNALREISQEIALSALARTDFFKYATFVGGSCLRIVHGLQRFSEDLDFWALKSSPHFLWKSYLEAIRDEFHTYAFDMIIEDRDKVDAKIKRAFLKKDSIGKILILSSARNFNNNEKLQIKLEIDTHPPDGVEIEMKNIDFPYPFSITTLNRSSLFASKIAALFNRKKEKGRHWYDFTWYVDHKWPINYQMLESILFTDQKSISFPQLQTMLVDLIESIDWNVLRDDVRNFISSKEQEILNLWNKQFFLGYVEALGEYLKPTSISLGSLIAEEKVAHLMEKRIKEALASGSFVDDDSRNGHRPLQMAISKGYKAIARLLIEHGADINYRDRSGLTPLQTAINNNQFEIAILLIQKGAFFDPNAPNLAFDQTKLYEFQHFWLQQVH